MVGIWPEHYLKVQLSSSDCSLFRTDGDLNESLGILREMAWWWTHATCVFNHNIALGPLVSQLRQSHLHIPKLIMRKFYRKQASFRISSKIFPFKFISSSLDKLMLFYFLVSYVVWFLKQTFLPNI